MQVEWASLKASELRDLAARGAIVVLPVAAMEQHGPHLPVMVDTLLCGEVARRAAQRVSGRHPVVVAPTVWSGLSEHHMPFGGTFTPETPPPDRNNPECVERELPWTGNAEVVGDAPSG